MFFHDTKYQTILFVCQTFLFVIIRVCRVIELPTIEDTDAKGQMPSSLNESDKETQIPPSPILDVKGDKAKSFLYNLYRHNKICVLMFYLCDEILLPVIIGHIIYEL